MLFIIRSSVLDMMDMMKRKSWGSKTDLDAVVSRERSAEQTIMVFAEKSTFEKTQESPKRLDPAGILAE